MGGTKPYVIRRASAPDDAVGPADVSWINAGFPKSAAMLSLLAAALAVRIVFSKPLLGLSFETPLHILALEDGVGLDVGLSIKRQRCALRPSLGGGLILDAATIPPLLQLALLRLGQSRGLPCLFRRALGSASPIEELCDLADLVGPIHGGGR